MSDSKDLIKIIKPSPEIFKIINFYKKLVKNIIPNSKITLIGSFAIPMCGKEEFDLLVETDDVKKTQELIQKKSSGRFGIGPIIDEEGYCRSKKKYGIICELHIINKGNKKIKGYLNLVNKLKLKPNLVKKYEKLKMSLDDSTEDRYKKEKDKFLKENGLV